jgi:nicotinate-nucleotide adenylyltransferase
VSGLVAVLGGTFDPIHFGHLRAAVEAREKLGLGTLSLMPAGTPPHRDSTGATAAQRLHMVRVAVQAYPDLLVDPREAEREGSSWMVDTLTGLRAELGPHRSLGLLVGQDAVNQLDSWKDWRRLFELAHIIVMRRPDSPHAYSRELFEEVQPRLTESIPALQTQAAGLVLPLEVTQLAISSTDIRQRLAAGKSCRFLLPDAVIDYLVETGLYGASRA